MTEELKCEKVVRIDDGTDPQGRPLCHHQKCSKPASEITLSGMLTTAKAILCPGHAKAARRQSFISEKGFPKGKVADRDVSQTKIEPAIGLVRE